MGIVNEIEDRAAEYMKITGARPTRIYLGETEMSDLIRAIAPMVLHRSRHIDGRSEFLGMSIFEVKDNAPHIWCGV